jgi:hypothetical protein
MSRKTIKKIEKQEARIDHYQMPLAWGTYKEARKDAHEERMLGRRVVLQARTFGGWMMSGEWERPETRFRVRYAR